MATPAHKEHNRLSQVRIGSLIEKAVDALGKADDNWNVFKHTDFSIKWFYNRIDSKTSKELLYTEVTCISDKDRKIKLHAVFGESYRDVHVREIDIIYHSDYDFTVVVSKQVKDFAIDYYQAVSRIKDYHCA